MTTKVYNEEGDEIEALTEEELEAEKKAAVDTAVKESNDKLTAKETELAKALEDLKKYQDKDYNFKGARDQIENKSKEVDEIRKELDTLKGSVVSELAKLKDSSVAEHKSEILKVLAGEDEELKKKIEFNYERFKDPSDTKDQVEQKLKDSYLIATGSSVPNKLSSVISSAKARPITADSIPSEVKGVAGKFGLSEEDLKKYWPKQK